MRKVVFFSLILAIAWCSLTAVQGEKDAVLKQVPAIQPNIPNGDDSKDVDTPKTLNIVPLTRIDGISVKETNPTPVHIEYQPTLINRNEPKDANPVYLPSDYDARIKDRNQPKEAVIGNSVGQTRVDADGYEPDNTAATAHYLTVTSTLQSENHTIHDFGGVDVDWYYFYGIPGRTYTFYSTSSMDNKIYLYQNDGTTQIDWDDDDGDGLNFYLEFSPSSAANYRLKVDAYYMNAGPYVFYFKTGAIPDSYELDDSVAYAQQIYPTPAVQTQNHTIHNSTDVDWYKFQALTGRI